MSLQDATSSPYSLTARPGRRMNDIPLYRPPRTQEIDRFVDWKELSPTRPNTEKAVSLEQFARKVDSSKVSQNSRGAHAGLKFLTKLKTAWDLSDAEFSKLLGRPEPILGARITPFSESEISEPSQQERIVALVNIHRKLFGLFKDIDVERTWLRTKLPVLHAKAPIDLVTDGSFRSLFYVEDIVLALTGT